MRRSTIPTIQIGTSLCYIEILIARMQLEETRRLKKFQSHNFCQRALISDHRGKIDFGGDGCHSYIPKAHTSTD